MKLFANPFINGGHLKDNDPGKFSLRDGINMVINELQKMNSRLEVMERHLAKVGSQSETARKLSEAGKKSAAARKAKFGSAAPSKLRGVEPSVVIVDDPIPDVTKNSNLFGEPLREPVQKSRKKTTKPKDGPTPGSVVWGEYELAYQMRWNVSPLRNARANKHCSELVALLGAERAQGLVRYYLTRNDAVYLKAKHPLGILIVDVQKLNTELQTGNEMTARDAQRAENTAVNDRVVRQYLAKQEGAEPLHEQVHVKEAKNAAP